MRQAASLVVFGVLVAVAGCGSSGSSPGTGTAGNNGSGGLGGSTGSSGTGGTSAGGTGGTLANCHRSAWRPVTLHDQSTAAGLTSNTCAFDVAV